MTEQIEFFPPGPRITRRATTTTGRRRKPARPDGTAMRRAEKGEARCGDCVHVRQRMFSKTYTKCELTDSGGSATDIGVRDAACRLYEQKETT